VCQVFNQQVELVALLSRVVHKRFADLFLFDHHRSWMSATGPEQSLRVRQLPRE
jgi:hypothetical protein